MRRFAVNLVNPHGHVTDTQIIEGIRFNDGTVVVRWVSEFSSIVIWKNMEDFTKVSLAQPGRDFIWLDDENGISL